MKTKIKYKILLFLFGLSFLASVVLSFIPIEQACGGIETTCYAVQTSQYETTFGIKNGYLGLVAFSFISILIITHLRNPSKRKKQIIILGVIGGTIFALYFLYLQFFVLDALCKYCIVIDISMLLGFGIMTFWKEK